MAKIAILFVVWVVFTAFLMSSGEKEVEQRQISIPESRLKDFVLREIPPDPRIALNLEGAFVPDHASNETTTFVYIVIQLLHLTNNTATITTPDLNMDAMQKLQWNKAMRDSADKSAFENITAVWVLPVVPYENLDEAPEYKKRNVFTFEQVALNQIKSGNALMQVRFLTNFNYSFPMKFNYDATPINTDLGLILAAIVLLGLYIMIIWEVVHRTFAAIIASTLSIGILAMMNEKPSMQTLMSWIDVETLLLLFGMMILVAILSETGIFDYLAVYAYKVR